MEFVPNEGVNMEFYEDSIYSEYQSINAAHPVHIPTTFVRIQVPGSQNTIIEVPAEDVHKRRFAEQWRRYQMGDVASAKGGWALESWPSVNTAQVKTLKYMGVHTVEQLASLSDDAVGKIGPGTSDLRAKAKGMLNAAKSNAAAEKQALENKHLHEEIEALKAMIQAQAAEREAEKKTAEVHVNKEQEEHPQAPDEPVKRGPGRPPKADKE